MPKEWGEEVCRKKKGGSKTLGKRGESSPLTYFSEEEHVAVGRHTGNGKRNDKGGKNYPKTLAGKPQWTADERTESSPIIQELGGGGDFLSTIAFLTSGGKTSPMTD